MQFKYIRKVRGVCVVVFFLFLFFSFDIVNSLKNVTGWFCQCAVTVMNIETKKQIKIFEQEDRCWKSQGE